MRCVPRVPAKQLQSVALRYCGVLDRSRLPIARRHRWWDLAPAKSVKLSAGGLLADGENPVARRQRLEAVLLLAREPLHSRKLAQYARLEDGTEARTIVRQLNQLYDEAGRAFRVEEVAGGFRLLTRRHFAPWLRRLEHIPPQVRLSAPAMETLAVVAYRQPVLRAEIEAIRGVNCGEIVRQLMERDLVRIGGRSNDLGRPYLYTTTKHFLQLFGLQNLNDLPRAFALRDTDGSTDPTAPELLDDPVSKDPVSKGPVSDDPVSDDPVSDDEEQQEKSEVSVTSPTQLPVDELLEEMSSKTAVAPRGAYDSDEFEDNEFDDGDDGDVDDGDEFEEFDDDDDELDEDFDDDGFEDDAWEEVEDDDDDDEEWDEEEEQWEDEFEEEVEDDVDVEIEIDDDVADADVADADVADEDDVDEDDVDEDDVDAADDDEDWE